MPQTIYTPTRSNRAHEAAQALRQGLAAAVSAGFDASAITADELQEAVGGSAGHGAKLLAAGELDLAHAMLVYNALVETAANDADAGVVAFKDAVTAALDSIADLPAAGG